MEERERAILEPLKREVRLCATNPPHPIIQSLVAHGYCRLARARSGPLGIYTGEVMVGLTEAGRAALEAA